MKNISDFLIKENLINEGHKVQYKKEIIYDLDFNKYLISDFYGGKFDWFKSSGELEDNVSIGDGGTTEISMTVTYNNKSSNVILKVFYENQDIRCDKLKITNSLGIDENEWYDILLYVCSLSNGEFLIEDNKEIMLKMIKSEIKK